MAKQGINKRIKKKLDIDKCIIIGDAKRVLEGVFPIKNKHTLSQKLAVSMNESANTIYSKLYRYEKDGFYTENKKFISDICKTLRVTREELVTKF